MTRTTQQMFGKLQRDLAATARMEREEAVDRQRRVNQEQARLDESVTRREIIEALENVANEFGCAGFPENEAIAGCVPQTRRGIVMTATVLNFPPQPGVLSQVTLLRLDGTLFATERFLPSRPEAAWSWIVEVVAAELDCDPASLSTQDDAVTVDGLPCYMVEIIRPACFSAQGKC